MATNAALDAVMNQAQEAANNFQTPAPYAPNTTGSGQVPVPANNNGTQLAKPSLATAIQGGGMDVDEYFQVKAEGFRIGKDFKGLLEELTVEIDMTEVQVMYSARSEIGGNTTFIRSYDGVTTSDGRNFDLACKQLEARGGKYSGVYESAEVPCTILEDVKDPKSSLVVEEGTTVGYTPSVTGFKPLRKFLKDLAKRDPALLEETLKVKLVHEKKTNSNNNEWGVLKFELVD